MDTLNKLIVTILMSGIIWCGMMAISHAEEIIVTVKEFNSETGKYEVVKPGESTVGSWVIVHTYKGNDEEVNVIVNSKNRKAEFDPLVEVNAPCAIKKERDRRLEFAPFLDSIVDEYKEKEKEKEE